MYRGNENCQNAISHESSIGVTVIFYQFKLCGLFIFSNRCHCLKQILIFIIYSNNFAKFLASETDKGLTRRI